MLTLVLNHDGRPRVVKLGVALSYFGIDVGQVERTPEERRRRKQARRQEARRRELERERGP